MRRLGFFIMTLLAIGSLSACTNEHVTLFAKEPTTLVKKPDVKNFVAKHPARFVVKTPDIIQSFASKLKRMDGSVEAPGELFRMFDAFTVRSYPGRTAHNKFDFNHILRSSEFQACSEGTIRAGDVLVFWHRQAPLFIGVVASMTAHFDWSQYTSKQWLKAVDSLLLADVRQATFVKDEQDKKSLQGFEPLCMRHVSFAESWSKSEQKKNDDTVSFEKVRLGMYQEFERFSKPWLTIENAFISKITIGNNLRVACGVGMQTVCEAPQLGALDVVVGGLGETQSVSIKMVRESETLSTSVVENIKVSVENGLARFQAQASLGEKVYFYVEGFIGGEGESAHSVWFR